MDLFTNRKCKVRIDKNSILILTHNSLIRNIKFGEQIIVYYT